jgi:DNA modification methylase
MAVFNETLPFLPLLQSTDVGDTVLDCFSGSGTFGALANLFGRKYIGIEIKKEYHDMATTRLEKINTMVDLKVVKMFEKKIAA